jgi:hypothetical protein
MSSEKVFHRSGTCNYESYDKTAGVGACKGSSILGAMVTGPKCILDKRGSVGGPATRQLP